MSFEAYLDTLSNGFWVVDENQFCEDGSYCDQGIYVLKNSSTGKKLDKAFTYSNWGFPIESIAVADVLKIGDTKVDNMTFGVLSPSVENSTNLSTSKSATATFSIRAFTD